MSCLSLFPVGGIAALTDDNAASTALNGLGLCIMVVAIGSVVSLVVWCYSRILRRPPDSDS
ncbi:MAG: hypothetical protein WAT39_19580 [Planctomycetota bacterium]